MAGIFFNMSGEVDSQCVQWCQDSIGILQGEINKEPYALLVFIFALLLGQQIIQYIIPLIRESEQPIYYKIYGWCGNFAIVLLGGLLLYYLL